MIISPAHNRTGVFELINLFKMRKTVFFLFSLKLICVYGGQYDYKIDQICVRTTSSSNEQACNELSKNESYVCDQSYGMDCFLKINKGDSRLAIMEPEQSLLASAFVSERVVVIGVVSSEILPYQTTVIIRKPYNSFESLRGKKFCHPGYNHDEAITKYVLDQFELKIISLNSSFCYMDEDITVAERNVKAISNFFASSCKPGPWTTNKELDIKWKSTYSNLCDLCGPQKCAVDYKVPFNDTLQCLTQNSGDVALTTLRDSQEFLSKSMNTFQYLCPNGSVSSEMNPCTWTNQLNPLIITEKDVAEFAQKYLQNHLQNHISKDATKTLITKSLEQIFALKDSDKINLLKSPVPLKTYVESRRSIPSIENSTLCNTTVKWCTVQNNAQQKCMWLSQAAVNYGLQPSIECVQNDVDDSCVENIQSEKTDFAFVNISYGVLAKQNGLAAIAYPADVEEQLDTILIVIRNDTLDITSLKDLKGKRACFPEYAGKEWLAFIDVMRNSGLMPISCDYDNIFGDFVGTSCVPGARSRIYHNNIDLREKLCAQCIPFTDRLTAKYCNADEGNKYYTSDGSLRCLNDQSADYAVISVNEVTPSYDTSMYRVLCKNGSLAPIPGLQVDREAALTVIASGEIVARNESAKRDDIVLLLKEISAQFGKNPMAAFRAFGEFGEMKNVLLPDTMFGLSFGNNVTKYVKNFNTLLDNSEKCVVQTSGSGTSYNLVLSTVLLLVGFFFIRF